MESWNEQPICKKQNKLAIVGGGSAGIAPFIGNFSQGQQLADQGVSIHDPRGLSGSGQLAGLTNYANSPPIDQLAGIDQKIQQAIFKTLQRDIPELKEISSINDRRLKEVYPLDQVLQVILEIAATQVRENISNLEIEKELIETITIKNDGTFLLEDASKKQYSAKNVLLATGVRQEDIEGITGTQFKGDTLLRESAKQLFEHCKKSNTDTVNFLGASHSGWSVQHELLRYVSENPDEIESYPNSLIRFSGNIKPYYPSLAEAQNNNYQPEAAEIFKGTDDDSGNGKINRYDGVRESALAVYELVETYNKAYIKLSAQNNHHGNIKQKALAAALRKYNEPGFKEKLKLPKLNEGILRIILPKIKLEECSIDQYIAKSSDQDASRILVNSLGYKAITPTILDQHGNLIDLKTSSRASAIITTDDYRVINKKTQQGINGLRGNGIAFSPEDQVGIVGVETTFARGSQIRTQLLATN